jgi:hypothetical protein
VEKRPEFLGRCGVTAQPPAASHEHRPERPVLLAVDQQLGEGAGGGVPPVGADRIDPVEVREHEDVQQFGAGSGAEGI